MSLNVSNHIGIMCLFYCVCCLFLIQPMSYFSHTDNKYESISFTYSLSGEENVFIRPQIISDSRHDGSIHTDMFPACCAVFASPPQPSCVRWSDWIIGRTCLSAAADSHRLLRAPTPRAGCVTGSQHLLLTCLKQNPHLCFYMFAHYWWWAVRALTMPQNKVHTASFVWEEAWSLCVDPNQQAGVFVFLQVPQVMNMLQISMWKPLISPLTPPIWLISPMELLQMWLLCCCMEATLFRSKG